MKNLFKNNIVTPVLGTMLLVSKNGVKSFTSPNDEQNTVLKAVINFVMLLLTLPAITTLLLVWFKLK